MSKRWIEYSVAAGGMEVWLAEETKGTVWPAFVPGGSFLEQARFYVPTKQNWFMAWWSPRSYQDRLKDAVAKLETIRECIELIEMKRTKTINEARRLVNDDRPRLTA